MSSLPPQTVSHFELLDKLGEGGMGTVYRARDTRLDRIVALKFLSPKRVDSPKDRERFRQEGRMLSALNHPHVAVVYEVDEIGGLPFLALEYLPGGTLRSRIMDAKGCLPLSRFTIWATELAEALAHAHRQGVIHGDVKSTNAMFDAEGRVKLTDFGLATTLQADPAPTEGKVAGTIGYMAPELLLGKAADPRSDLFSLGVLFYEMATGQLPFHAKTSTDAAQRVLTAQPNPVRQIRTDLPIRMEAIINRLLEKRPEDRYARAEDVARDLQNARNSSSDDVPTQTMSEIPRARWFWRRRWWILAMAGLALLLFGLTGADLMRRFAWKRSLPRRKNIAVLPFRNIGGDDGQQAFCDGLTESLTAALTRYGGFSVVPAADARKLESTVQARREFGVNLVLAGSIQRRGDEVRLIVSLIDAADLRQIDAEPMNWPVGTLFQMEDVVLTKIGNLLDVAELESPGPLVAGASQIPAAYDGYLRGRGYLYRFDRPGNLESARQQFEAALQQDAKFAAAYVGLADVQLRQYRLRRDAALLEAAKSNAGRALDLNPRLADAHVSLGTVLAEMRQPEQAIHELELAIQLDPRNPVAYRELANLHRFKKQFREAEQVYQRAIEARPGDWISYSNLGVFYFVRQRYADSERMFRKVIELTPDNHLGYRLLGTTMAEAGRDLPGAEKLFRKAISLNPTGRSYSNLGFLLMLQNRFKEAVPVMQKAVELSARESPGDYKPYGNLGDAYQLAGDSRDKAIEAWKRALEIVDQRLKADADNAELLVSRGLYRGKIGEATAAVEDADRAQTQAPRNATVRYLAALTFAVVGSKTRALEALGAAINLGYSVEEIRHAPEFSTFRGDHEFEQLLSKAASH